MIPAFTFFPPEINSALIFGGAGPGPLLTAAAAWDVLAADLSDAAASFNSVISELAGGAWLGPASVAMTAAAAPYLQWLNAAVGQAEAAAAQARAAAAAYEGASAATVPTPAVYANRVRLITLIATNFLGQNTPAIAMTELEYLEMWAQDVAAMLGYHSQATSLASTLPPFSVPPGGLAGLAGAVTTPVANLISEFAGALSSAGTAFFSQVQSLMAAFSPAISSLSSVLSSAPVSTLSSVAQIGVYPATALMSPMLVMAQGAGPAAPAAPVLVGATNPAADAPAAAVAGSAVSGLQPMGGLGAAAAGLGQARFVGAISVPPTWQGAMPAPVVTSGMPGLGSGMSTTGAGGSTGGGSAMPMPMDDKDAKGGKPDAMMRRGGARPHVVQSRPKVVRRNGVG